MLRDAAPIGSALGEVAYQFILAEGSRHNVLTALPRTRRDELEPRIVMLADRLQSDSQQLKRWTDEHWDDNTLNWQA